MEHVFIRKYDFANCCHEEARAGARVGAGRAIKLSTQYFCWQQYGKSQTATDTITTISTIYYLASASLFTPL